MSVRKEREVDCCCRSKSQRQDCSRETSFARRVLCRDLRVTRGKRERQRHFHSGRVFVVTRSSHCLTGSRLVEQRASSRGTRGAAEDKNTTLALSLPSFYSLLYFRSALDARVARLSGRRQADRRRREGIARARVRETQGSEKLRQKGREGAEV